MIQDHDRSGWIGASDTAFVIGNWNTKTWKDWWLKKLGVDNSHFDNQYTLAGTHYEHRILRSLDIPDMVLDAQILLPDISLRVNLDGNTADTNYECKTFKWENGFKVPKKYRDQTQVQMYASGLRKTVLVAYGLTAAEYKNFFLPIDPDRRLTFPIIYDELWIERVYLPKLRELSRCLKEGILPESVVAFWNR